MTRNVPALVIGVVLSLFAVAAAVLGVLTEGTPRLATLVVAGLSVFAAAACMAAAVLPRRAAS